jgi:hypothetical protein
MTPAIELDAAPLAPPLPDTDPPWRGALFAAIVLAPGVALACAGLVAIAATAASLAGGGAF